MVWRKHPASERPLKTSWRASTSTTWVHIFLRIFRPSNLCKRIRRCPLSRHPYLLNSSGGAPASQGSLSASESLLCLLIRMHLLDSNLFFSQKVATCFFHVCFGNSFNLYESFQKTVFLCFIEGSWHLMGWFPWSFNFWVYCHAPLGEGISD